MVLPITSNNEQFHADKDKCTWTELCHWSWRNNFEYTQSMLCATGTYFLMQSHNEMSELNNSPFLQDQSTEGSTRTHDNLQNLHGQKCNKTLKLLPGMTHIPCSGCLQLLVIIAVVVLTSQPCLNILTAHWNVGTQRRIIAGRESQVRCSKCHLECFTSPLPEVHGTKFQILAS